MHNSGATGSKSKKVAAANTYPLSDSAKSSIGRAQNHQEHSTAADRKPKGNNAHIPIEQKVLCEMCNSYITDKPNLISQHRQSSKHIQNVAAAQKRVSAEGSSTAFCETCHVEYPRTPDGTREHMDSASHSRMRRWGTEQHRDGAILLKRQQQDNDQAAAAKKAKK